MSGVGQAREMELGPSVSVGLPFCCVSECVCECTRTMPPARCSWADPGARATASPHDPAGRVGPGRPTPRPLPPTPGTWEGAPRCPGRPRSQALIAAFPTQQREKRRKCPPRCPARGPGRRANESAASCFRSERRAILRRSGTSASHGLSGAGGLPWLCPPPAGRARPPGATPARPSAAGRLPRLLPRKAPDTPGLSLKDGRPTPSPAPGSAGRRSRG